MVAEFQRKIFLWSAPWGKVELVRNEMMRTDSQECSDVIEVGIGWNAYDSNDGSDSGARQAKAYGDPYAL